MVGHTFPADLWALGCVMFEMWCGSPPFSADGIQNPNQVMERIRDGKFKFPFPQTSTTTRTTGSILEFLIRKLTDR